MSQTQPRKSPSRPPVRRRRRFSFGRFLAAATILLLGAGLIYGGSLVWNSAALRKYLPALLPAILHPKTPADVFANQSALNLLVIGRDYDYSNKDQIIKTHARSDMLMVAHLDFVDQRVTFLSIPRDTRALVPHHGICKINAAHAYGGPALTAETIDQNFGIPSDKYVALDFQGFEKAIDQIGGVDLTVDKKMDYDDNWGHLHIHLKPGYQHLNGAQAMGFVRMRHSDSDFVRVQRQQALIAALKTKLREPATLAKLPALLDTLDRHLDSNLTTDQKVVLARFIHDTPRDQIQMQTLPSRETSGAFVATDWPKAIPMIQSIFGVTPPELLAEGSSDMRHHRHQRRRMATRVAERP